MTIRRPNRPLIGGLPGEKMNVVQDDFGPIAGVLEVERGNTRKAWDGHPIHLVLVPVLFDADVCARNRDFLVGIQPCACADLCRISLIAFETD
jgi:hypothetical protein